MLASSAMRTVRLTEDLVVGVVSLLVTRGEERTSVTLPCRDLFFSVRQIFS